MRNESLKKKRLKKIPCCHYDYDFMTNCPIALTGLRGGIVQIAHRSSII